MSGFHHRADAASVAESLRWGVSRLSTRLRSERGGDDAGLTRLGVSILANLKASGPATASQLAAMEGLQRQSLTRALNDLQAAHRIERRASVTDGREQDVLLTEEGRAALSEHVRAGNVWLADALTDLTDTERGVLALAADLLVQIAGAPPESPSRSGAAPPL